MTFNGDKHDAKARQKLMTLGQYCELAIILGGDINQAIIALAGGEPAPCPGPNF